MKTCNLCGLEKPLSEFNRNKRASDGYSYYCRLCRAAVSRRWRQENKEKVLAQRERWNQENLEKILAQSRKYYAENREKVQARQRRYQQKYPEKLRNLAMLRRVRNLGAKGVATDEQIQARIDLYGGMCYICGKPYEAIDHVIPLAKGGSNWPANLRPICQSCNSSKGSKSLSVYLGNTH